MWTFKEFQMTYLAVEWSAKEKDQQTMVICLISFGVFLERVSHMCDELV